MKREEGCGERQRQRLSPSKSAFAPSAAPCSLFRSIERTNQLSNELHPQCGDILPPFVLM